MYQEYYHLRSMPFQLSPDPEFFYASPGHKRVLSYLQYGVHQGDGFIVVTGDVGTGKTTLIRRLLNELKLSADIVAAQLTSTQLSEDDLLRMILAAFGLKHEGLSKPSLLINLEKFLRDLAQKGKRVLLIVDEAQNLPVKAIEELRMLSNYQEGNRALFQSFLVGQEEFRKILKDEQLEQLRQRIVASYHLGPLSEADTQGYIEHRLKTCGWAKDPIITPAAYTSIYNYSSGIPRKINTLCDRIFLYSSLREIHEVDEAVVAEVTAELGDEVVNANTTGEVDVATGGNVMTFENDVRGARRISLEERISRLELLFDRLAEVIIEGRDDKTRKTTKKK